MIIKVDKIHIKFDENIKQLITPKYLGRPKDIKKVKENLSYAYDMYGHKISPDTVFAGDLMYAIKQKYPDTKIPEYDYYTPLIPRGKNIIS